jgi:hypothetical protein
MSSNTTAYRIAVDRQRRLNPTTRNMARGSQKYVTVSRAFWYPGSSVK